MRLLVLQDSRLRSTIDAGSEPVLIGSGPQCQVHLPDARISPHQASVSCDTDGCWWLDIVDTSTPTSLNRTILKGRTKLRHADEIEIGSFAIRLFMQVDQQRESARRDRLAALARQHGAGLPPDTIVRLTEQDLVVSRELLEQLTLLAVRLGLLENVTELLTPIVRTVFRMFAGRRAWIGVRREGHGPFEWTLGLTTSGQVCERPPYSTKMEGRCVEGGQYLCVPEANVPGLRSAMAVPLAGQAGILGMLYVENDSPDDAYTEASLNGLATLASVVSMPVENVLRRTSAKRQALVVSEATVARATQDALTPRALPRWKDLQVAAFRHMGATRCCDLYDIVQLRDHTAALVVARVQATGARLMRLFAELRAAFRMAGLYAEAPHLFARALNWLVFDGSSGVMDAVIVWVAPAGGKVQYCAAGEGVYVGILHPDGACTSTPASGQPEIGRQRAATYEAAQLQLAPGDCLYLASAGVESARNAKEEVLGRAGLEESLCDGLGKGPGHLLSEFSSDLTGFIAGGSCADDVTVVVVQRAGDAEL